MIWLSAIRLVLYKSFFLKFIDIYVKLYDIPFFIGLFLMVFSSSVTSLSNTGSKLPNNISSPENAQIINHQLLSKGVDIFSQRCTLCHGSSGLGEGILALKIKDYPNTNLLIRRKANTQKEIKNIIMQGGVNENAISYMPPFKQELTQIEIDSVVEFVMLLKNAPESAQQLIQQQKNSVPSKLTPKYGKNIYMTRCTLCHGKSGEGDGRMAKLLKTPPPFDLTASRLPDEYLQKIIKKGGEAVGRSKHMPPWGEQLNQQEVDAVIEYIKSIRN